MSNNWEEKFEALCLNGNAETEDGVKFIKEEIIEKLIEEIKPLDWCELSPNGIEKAKQQLRAYWLGKE